MLFQIKKPFSSLRGLILAIFIVALFANVFLFIYHTANPYCRSDAWSELNDFLIPCWNQGYFSVSDLYKIRISSHHTQVLNRILLVCNAKLFGLDFRAEAMFASLFLLGIVCVLLRHLYFITAIKKINWKSFVVLSAFVTLIVNLNTTVNYVWSLVTLGYISVFVILVLYLHLSKRLLKSQTPNLITVVLLTVVLLLGDNIGVTAVLSCVFVSLVVAIHKKHPKTLVTTAVLVIAVLLYSFIRHQLVINAGTPVQEGGRAVLGLEYLWNHLAELPSIITAPFSSSVIQIDHLAKFFPSNAFAAASALGACVIGLHLWCWVLYIKHKLYKKTLLPAMLLILSYGLILAIILYRVPNFGINVLHSPRYSITYQLGLWGCGLIIAALFMSNDLRSKYKTFTLTAIAVCLLMLQSLFIVRAWRSSPYIVNYSETHAEQVLYYAGISETEAPCPESGGSKFCRLREGNKQKFVEFLQKNELNFFNPRILRQHNEFIKKRNKIINKRKNKH